MNVFNRCNILRSKLKLKMCSVTLKFSVRKQIIAAIVFTCFLESVHCDLKQCGSKLTFNKKHIGQRLVGFNIVTLTDESIGTCVNKCFQLTHCLSTNFDTVSKQCDLNNITAGEMPTAIVKSGTSILSDLSAWPKAMMGSCGDKPCNGRDICLPAGNTFFCHNSDCPKAPIFGKATSTGSVKIGGKMVYKCTNLFHRIVGQDYVLCGWMNTWSSNTAITCTAASNTATGGGGTSTGPAGTVLSTTSAYTTTAGDGGTSTGPAGTVPSPTTAYTTTAGDGGTTTGLACTGPSPTTTSTTAAGGGGTTAGPAGTVPSQTTDSSTAAGGGGTTAGPAGTVPSPTAAYTTVAVVGDTTTGPACTVPSPTTASTTAAVVDDMTTGPAEQCYDTQTHTMYVGHYAKTQSGKTCQRWDSQTPHAHDRNDTARFPDATLADAANYCRDPDNEGFLWCYTTDPAIRFDGCGMIRC